VVENNYYSIISDSIEFKKSNLNGGGPFGIPYGFFLDDALVGKKKEYLDRVDIHYVPEYLILFK
jgi:hypothetical protein